MPLELAGFTSFPIQCPILASCIDQGLEYPDWSWLGLALMLLMLLMLMAILEYVRVAGRRTRQGHTQEDEIMQLIGAVGFKVSWG
jgi:membrane protein implicated in regulation of membrane protease activity